MAKKKSENQEPIKRLYRSKEDKVIAGVCGGIAEFFIIDPVWVRLLAIILIFFEGVGVILYIIFWVLMPENPNQKNLKKTVVEEKVEIISKEIKETHKKRETNGHIYIGIIMIFVGLLFLLKNFFGWFDSDVFLALLIIGVGVMMLLKKHN